MVAATAPPSEAPQAVWPSLSAVQLREELGRLSAPQRAPASQGFNSLQRQAVLGPEAVTEGDDGRVELSLSQIEDIQTLENGADPLGKSIGRFGPLTEAEIRGLEVSMPCGACGAPTTTPRPPVAAAATVAELRRLFTAATLEDVNDLPNALASWRRIRPIKDRRAELRIKTLRLLLCAVLRRFSVTRGLCALVRQVSASSTLAARSLGAPLLRRLLQLTPDRLLLPHCARRAFPRPAAGVCNCTPSLTAAFPAPPAPTPWPALANSNQHLVSLLAFFPPAVFQRSHPLEDLPAQLSLRQITKDAERDILILSGTALDGRRGADATLAALLEQLEVVECQLQTMQASRVDSRGPPAAASTQLFAADVAAEAEYGQIEGMLNPGSAPEKFGSVMPYPSVCAPAFRVCTICGCVPCCCSSSSSGSSVLSVSRHSACSCCCCPFHGDGVAAPARMHTHKRRNEHIPPATERDASAGGSFSACTASSPRPDASNGCERSHCSSAVDLSHYINCAPESGTHACFGGVARREACSSFSSCCLRRSRRFCLAVLLLHLSSRTHSGGSLFEILQAVIRPQGLDDWTVVPLSASAQPCEMLILPCARQPSGSTVPGAVGRQQDRQVLSADGDSIPLGPTTTPTSCKFEAPSLAADTTESEHVSAGSTNRVIEPDGNQGVNTPSPRVLCVLKAHIPYRLFALTHRKESKQEYAGAAADAGGHGGELEGRSSIDTRPVIGTQTSTPPANCSRGDAAPFRSAAAQATGYLPVFSPRG
eukprot:GHVT01082904.1.p1 GENE.GHVT01082904.1~~GHVT01082904.1.p1  ORF type:complete len:765 (+),score=131.59 GHVT01082904.1:398-2692(+)